MEVELEHQDVLQNIEFVIKQVYRTHPDLIDEEVLTAIESLIRRYGAEAQGKTLSNRPIRGMTAEVAQAVQEICEIRLGRQPLSNEAGNADFLEPQSLEVIVACLKRLQSSIKFWTKKGGRQGYLEYMQQFLPE
jgi:hypothetical protein